MRRALPWLLAWLIGVHPAAVWAQQGAGAVQSFDALGVSFERIRRDLRTAPPSKVITPIKLEYYVEVVGVAPPFTLFSSEELSIGPVPGVPPSHADMMRHVTPLAFTAPAATLVSVGGRRGAPPKVVGQDFWQMQTRMAREAARRKKAEEERQKAVEAERLRQQRLRESVVVSPPK